jgi:hypothetical protein
MLQLRVNYQFNSCHKCVKLLSTIFLDKDQTSLDSYPVKQRFSNFFQVGTTFISQNVLRTTLLFSPLKANCLTFSTIVCDTQFTLILFFLSFLDKCSIKRTTRVEPENHLWSTDHSLRNAAVKYMILYFIILT